MTTPRDAITTVIHRYFDGLYHCDSTILRTVLHPDALYASATDGTLLKLTMAAYFPIVDARVSPASKNEPRSDRIVSIDFAGPVTALARVECAISPKHYIDFLTLIYIDERWQIIAKVFHYELKS
jgi:Putative lumazine-binding